MRSALLTCAAVVLLSGTTIADEKDDPITIAERNENRTAPESGLLLPQAVDVDALRAVRVNAEHKEATRPGWLPALYANSIALQTYDVYSTMTALSKGGVEINPLMRELTGNPGAWIAVKGGTTALSILAAEQLWKRKHRTAAVATMVVSNGILAIAAARNARVLASLR